MVFMQLKENILQTVQSFYHNEESAFELFIHTIDQIVGCLTQINNEVLGDFQNSLTQLLHAVERNDQVTICDIMEYELVPLLERG